MPAWLVRLQCLVNPADTGGVYAHLPLGTHRVVATGCSGVAVIGGIPCQRLTATTSRIEHLTHRAGKAFRGASSLPRPRVSPPSVRSSGRPSSKFPQRAPRAHFPLHRIFRRQSRFTSRPSRTGQERSFSRMPGPVLPHRRPTSSRWPTGRIPAGYNIRARGMMHNWSPLVIPVDSTGANLVLADTTQLLTVSGH